MTTETSEVNLKNIPCQCPIAIVKTNERSCFRGIIRRGEICENGERNPGRLRSAKIIFRLFVRVLVAIDDLQPPQRQGARHRTRERVSSGLKKQSQPEHGPTSGLVASDWLRQNACRPHSRSSKSLETIGGASYPRAGEK